MNDNLAIGHSARFADHSGEIGRLINSKVWDSTPLGNVKNWPASLSASVNICLTSSFPIAIWWGNDLIKIYNGSFRTLLQIKHPESLGTKGENLCPEIWNCLGPSLEGVLKDGNATESQCKLILRHEGVDQERYFTFFNSPIYDESGKVGGVFTVVSETTQSVLTPKVRRAVEVNEERNRMANESTDSKTQNDALEKKVQERTKLLVQMNEQLKLSEERYFKMTEEVQDYAIILLDKDGTIVNWNKGAEKIKGYTEHQIVGKNFSIFYLEEDRKSNLPERLIQEAQEYGRAMHEGWRKRKDGSRFWGSIVITALHDSKHNVIGFSKVTRDLTERKLAEDIMRQHASELEIKNKQLEQFAYIASHDLQEPLRKIRTFVQVLEKKINEPGAREKYFNKINASAKRMGELIQSVLNYSRLSQTDELWATTDLNSVLENVKADYELLIAEKNAIVQSERLPTIKGIPLQLSQLFANLIGNSLKFSHGKPVITISSAILKAGEAQKVNSELDNSKNYVELIFRDNGIGFEQHYAEKIFTIFQRLNSREDFMGTGIGLALCKKIVENHEGHIHARSELGKGAEFFVYLPLE